MCASSYCDAARIHIYNIIYDIISVGNLKKLVIQRIRQIWVTCAVLFMIVRKTKGHVRTDVSLCPTGISAIILCILYPPIYTDWYENIWLVHLTLFVFSVVFSYTYIIIHTHTSLFPTIPRTSDGEFEDTRFPYSGNVDRVYHFAPYTYRPVQYLGL